MNNLYANQKVLIFGLGLNQGGVGAAKFFASQGAKGRGTDLKTADILISVCGCPNMIKGESIKEGAILIDAGVTRYHDGKVVGDIDRESVKNKAVFLTPVPGGLGPLTVALLLRNVYLVAENLIKK